MGLPSSGHIIADRYRLIYELGRGGMGSVWEGEDERLERRVAIKLMAANLQTDDVALERFMREARAVAALNSPHIVEIHDFGVEPFPFMVMERLTGEVLSARLRQQVTLPLQEVAALSLQIAKALTVAHQAGIVHRDLKPGNIFLVRHQEDELVKVIDFGIARALSGKFSAQRLTLEGEMVGTLTYMSPEQIRTDDGDQGVDVWALAVILFRCLTGRKPFCGATVYETVSCIMRAEPPPPSTVDPSLAPGLDGLFARALAKDPSARFATVRELAEALCAIADVSIVPARAALASLSPADDAAPERHDFMPDDGPTVRLPKSEPPTLPTRPARPAGADHPPILDEEPTTLVAAHDDPSATLKKQGGWARRESHGRRGARPAMLLATAVAAITATAALITWLVVGPSDGATADPEPGPGPAASLPAAAAEPLPSAELPPASAAAAPVGSVTVAPEPSAAATASARASSTNPPPLQAKPTESENDDLFDSVY